MAASPQSRCQPALLRGGLAPLGHGVCSRGDTDAGLGPTHYTVFLIDPDCDNVEAVWMG
jgi:hypothetical protein